MVHSASRPFRCRASEVRYRFPGDAESIEKALFYDRTITHVALCAEFLLEADVHCLPIFRDEFRDLLGFLLAGALKFKNVSGGESRLTAH